VSPTNSLAAYFSPTIVTSLLCVLIASVIVPITLHYLKARKDERDRRFQIRHEAYTKYFKKFEDASSDISYDFTKLERETLPLSYKKLYESDCSPEAIVAFQNAVGEFPMKVFKTFETVNNELTGLQIVASPKLLTLTHEFEEVNREILSKSALWLQDLKTRFPDPSVQTPTSIELARLGERCQQLRTQIIDQMRQELGMNKD